MSGIRKTHSKKLKLKAALDLIRADKTIDQLCLEYGVHKSVLLRWKQTLIEGGDEIFEDQRGRSAKAKNALEYPAEKEALERKIGQLSMEVDFLKKVLGQ
jgi:transposase